MCLFISFHSTLSPFLLFSDKYIPTHTNITTYTDVCVCGGGCACACVCKRYNNATRSDQDSNFCR